MHIFDICQSNFIMFNLKTHPNEPQLRMVFFSEKFYSKKKKKSECFNLSVKDEVIEINKLFPFFTGTTSKNPSLKTTGLQRNGFSEGIKICHH